MSGNYPIGISGAEWRNDLQAGTSPRFESEFFQPFGFDSRYFVASRFEAGQDNYNIFTGADTIARYRVSEAQVGVDVGRTLGAWGETRVGVLRGVFVAVVHAVLRPLLPLGRQEKQRKETSSRRPLEHQKAQRCNG